MVISKEWALDELERIISWLLGVNVERNWLFVEESDLGQWKGLVKECNMQSKWNGA